MPRYNARTIGRVHFIPTIATSPTLTPTVAEMTAGKRLDTIIRSIAGFKFGGSTQDASSMDQEFPVNVRGNDTLDVGSFVCYQGDNAADTERVVQAALPKGTRGFVVFIPPVDGAAPAVAATVKCRIWPVEVTTNTPDETADDAAATFMIGFSHPAAPNLATTIIA